MKVLIIGSTGLVGSSLASFFAMQEDYEVFTVSRGSGDFRIDCSKSFIYGDYFKQLKFDLVICCVNTYCQDIDGAIEGNVESVKNILKAFCGQCGHIVFISSIFALSQNASQSIYNTTKAMAEDIIRLYYYQYKHDITILRFSQLFDQDGRARESQKGLFYFIDSINNQKNIAVFSKKEKLRNYFPADAIGTIVAYAFANHYYGEYNIISKYSVTNSDLIKYLVTGTQYDLSLVEYNNTKEALSYYIPECSQEFKAIVDTIPVMDKLKELIK